MIELIFQIIILLAIGVILVFSIGIWLHLNMRKNNQESREKALKTQTDEPST